MAAVSRLSVYEDLVNRVDNLDPVADKKTSRKFVEDVIKRIDENDPPLHEDLVRAGIKLREKYGNEYPNNLDIFDVDDVRDLGRGVFLFKTLLKRELKKEQKNMQPPDDVEMAMGGRKRRQGKKTRKPKKQKRYTRRR